MNRRNTITQPVVSSDSDEGGADRFDGPDFEMSRQDDYFRQKS